MSIGSCSWSSHLLYLAETEALTNSNFKKCQVVKLKNHLKKLVLSAIQIINTYVVPISCSSKKNL